MSHVSLKTTFGEPLPPWFQVRLADGSRLEVEAKRCDNRSLTTDLGESDKAIGRVFREIAIQFYPNQFSDDVAHCIRACTYREIQDANESVCKELVVPPETEKGVSGGIYLSLIVLVGIMIVGCFYTTLAEDGRFVPPQPGV